METKHKLGQDPEFAKSAYVSNEGSIDPPQEGMSKRFYAACAAMQGILANSKISEIVNNQFGDVSAERSNEIIATTSFEIADALLKHELL